MVAAQPVNRIGAHFDSPPATRPVLPQGERARGQLWNDVVFDAILALRNQLTSRNETIAAAAANSILELERTRMRHNKCVAGSRSINEAQEEFERNPSETSLSEPDEFDGGAEREVEALRTTDWIPDPPSARFGDHSDEVCKAFAARNEPIGSDEANQIVGAALDRWDSHWVDIPFGGFLAEMRRRGESLTRHDFAKPDPHSPGRCYNC